MSNEHTKALLTLASDLTFFNFNEVEIHETLELFRQMSENLQPRTGERAVIISLESGAYRMTLGPPRPEPGFDGELIFLTEETWSSRVGKEKTAPFLDFLEHEIPSEAHLSGEQTTTDPDEEIRLFHKNSNAPEGKPVFIPQHDEMDCGAACLSMIAHYYGKKISVPDYRSRVHVTREGASMLALKRAAEQTGFDAIGIYSGLNSNLLQVRTPFIALMDYHFVVVYTVTEKEFLVGDPAVGIRSIPLEEIRKSWSKFLLLLKPNSTFKDQKESSPTFRKYRRVFQGEGGRLFDIATASILSLSVGVITPLFMQTVFDRVFSEKSQDGLTALVIASVAATVASTFLGWVSTYTFSHLSIRLDSKFSALFMRHTLSLPSGFFAVRRVGDITTRVQELGVLRSFFTGDLLALLMSLLSAVMYSVLAALYDWRIPLLVFCLLFFQVLFVLKISKKISEIYQQSFKSSTKSQSLLYEQIHSIETLKILNQTTPARWRWEETLLDSLRLQRKLGLYTAISAGSSEFFREASLNICIFLCLYLYLLNDLTLGQIVAVTALIGNITPAIVHLVESLTTISQIKVSLARVDDVITSSPEKTEGRMDFDPYGKIEFRGVSFQYGNELSPYALRNVDLTINSGQSVAFVGTSGSGKTTLAQMIGLLHRPTQGSILIDGVDITTLDLERLRQHVGMVLQENNLFSASVLDNITLGDPNPSRQKAIEAAKIAQIDELIQTLPGTYDYLIDPVHSGLSMGQKQRIGIARAAYRNQAILILDEATSALDGITEKKIIEALMRHRKGKTTVVIAHRLSTVSGVDQICVFEKGTLAEKGTLKTLTRRRGRFSELFANQLQF